MKRIFFSAFIALSINSYGQSEKQIDSLNYAHMKIAVPENCEAKSEYELLDCDGVSIQWIYLNGLSSLAGTNFYGHKLYI